MSVWFKRLVCAHKGWECIGLDRVDVKCMRCGKVLRRLSQDETDRIRDADRLERQSALERSRERYLNAPKVLVGLQGYIFLDGAWFRPNMSCMVRATAQESLEANIRWELSQGRVVDDSFEDKDSVKEEN